MRTMMRTTGALKQLTAMGPSKLAALLSNWRAKLKVDLIAWSAPLTKCLEVSCLYALYARETALTYDPRQEDHHENLKKKRQ